MMTASAPARTLNVRLLTAYAAGTLGWTWDALEHAGLLHLPGNETAAHFLMYLSLLAAAVLTVQALRARTLATGAGVLVVLFGVVVDALWHRNHGEAMQTERNMLAVPGHAIELAGWVLGCLLLVALLSRAKGSA